MLFNYKIVTAQGQVKEGRHEAPSMQEARNHFILQGHTVLAMELARLHKKSVISNLQDLNFGHLALVERVMLAKHLAAMIKAGMGIDEALETIASTASPLMRKRLVQIINTIRGGVALSEALKKYPKDFDILFTNMVAVGETSGHLVESLDLLAQQQHKTYELKRKIKSASIYPIIIIVAVLMLVVVISIFVLPKITVFFKSLQITLPLATRILIGISNFFINYWPYVAGGAVAIFLAQRLLMRFANGRYFVHRILSKTPLIGKISQQVNMALFARTLGSLLASGITIDKGLQIVSHTMTNEVYKRITTSIYHQVLKGLALSDILATKKEFSPIFYRMCKVGERSGNLSEVLNYVADYYEGEVDNTTKNLSAILEPALLLFIGIVVAFVAVSIINPIYELTSKVGG